MNPTGSPILVQITPKVVRNFDNPRPCFEWLVKYYEPLLAKANPLIWIWSTGCGSHVLDYPGTQGHANNVAWARYTSFNPKMGHVSDAQQGRCDPKNFFAGPFWIVRDDTLSYAQIQKAIGVLREVCAEHGIKDVRVIEYLDPGPEFCEDDFKFKRHPEILTGWSEAVDVRANLKGDTFAYASYPKGIPDGLPVREFIAEQTAAYCEGLGFDGVYLGNGFGTREWWDPA